MTVHGDDVTAEGAERGRYVQLNGRVPVRTETQGKRVLFNFLIFFTLAQLFRTVCLKRSTTLIRVQHTQIENKRFTKTHAEKFS